MEFTIQRRIGGAKYGKSTKKVVVHDFFGWDQKTTSSSTASKNYLISPASSDSDGVPRKDVAVQQPQSPPVRHPTLAVPTPAPSPRHTVSSPSSTQKVTTQHNERSIFDLDFSDDDSRAARDVKRRKLEARLRPQPTKSENATATATRPKQVEPVKIETQPTHLKTRNTRPVSKAAGVAPSPIPPKSVSAPAHPAELGVDLPPSEPDREPEAIRTPINHRRPAAEVPKHHAQKPASRTQRRLLEAFDVSSKEVKVEDSTQPLNQKETAPNMHGRTLLHSDKPSLRPAPLLRNESSNNRRTYARLKATYSSREQSRLNQMVDQVDSTSTASSEDASQHIMSQLTLQTQPSQLQMQLELDNESSDDGTVGNKLKSIHELRLAGTASRVDREVESLMEDIDPSIKTNSKSLRLQALMKLIRRNTETSFVSSFSQKATDRLVSWSKHCSDEICLCLLHIVLWQLVRHEQSSPVKLHVLLGALMAVDTNTLTLKVNLNGLLKDRKQNLSKATSKDIADFESECATGAFIPDLSGGRVHTVAVTLGALNDALKALLAQGETQVSVTAGCLTSVVKLVKDCSADYLTSEESSIEHVSGTMKAAISVLQLFSGPFNTDLTLGVEGYKQLASCLSRVTATSKDLSMVQAVLHFVISLSNDKPAICSAIVSSGFGSTVLEITSTKLQALLHQTRERDNVDQDELDCVILCLACMLNLTEHENSVRLEFSVSHSHEAPSIDTNTTPSGNNISDLISLYTTLAPLLVGTQSASMGQLLVAFGYLCLLICSLARADSVKRQITALLLQEKTNSEEVEIEDVFASAKEFLIYLRIVESQQDSSGLVEVDGDETALEDSNSKRESRSAKDGLARRFEMIITELEAVIS